MKKIGVSLIAVMILILPAAIYVQAGKWEDSKDSYLGLIEKVLLENQEAMNKNSKRQLEQLEDAGKQRLHHFYLDKLSDIKNNVDDYQKDYLYELEHTKEKLKKHDWKKFEQQKTETLQKEIEQDVEEYLEEMLTEK